jgi:hypothetical protein
VPQTNLSPESGAEFFGKIECLDERLFRANCYAQLQRQGELERDTPKFWMCATQAAAEKWIEVQAAQRGFPTFKIVKIDSSPRGSPSDIAAHLPELSYTETGGSEVRRGAKRFWDGCRQHRKPGAGGETKRGAPTDAPCLRERTHVAVKLREGRIVREWRARSAGSWKGRRDGSALG